MKLLQKRNERITVVCVILKMFGFRKISSVLTVLILFFTIGTSYSSPQANRILLRSIEPSFNSMRSTSLPSTIYRQFSTTDKIHAFLPSISLTLLNDIINMRNTFTAIQFSTMGNIVSVFNAKSSLPYKHLVKGTTADIVELITSESVQVYKTNETLRLHASALGINSSSSSSEYYRTHAIALPTSFSSSKMCSIRGSSSPDSFFGVSSIEPMTTTRKPQTTFSVQPSASNILLHSINETTRLHLLGTMTTISTVPFLISDSTHYTQSILFLKDSTSKTRLYSSIPIHRSVSSSNIFDSLTTTDFDSDHLASNTPAVSLDSVKLSSSSSHHVSEISTISFALLKLSSSLFDTQSGYPTQMRHSRHSPVLPQDSSINSSIFMNKSMLRPGHNNIVLPAFPGYGFLNFTSGRDNCDALTKRIPHTIVFNETEPAGTVFFRLRTVENFTLDVKITEPSEVTSVLGGYLKFQKSNESYMFTLSRPIDIEEIFEITGRGVRLKTMKVTVTCKRQVSQFGIVDDGEAIINVTVLDVDDTPPHFVYQGDAKTCAVPVYSADASEHYTGLLEIKPGKIEAVDGDMFEQNNISYTVIHAEPENYDSYFCLDPSSGNVNKTKTMGAADPRKYVLIVKAVEDSLQKLNRVAILSIQVFAPTNPFKDDTPAVNHVVLLVLQILSILLYLSFLVGFIVIFYHRMKKTMQAKVSSKEDKDDDDVVDTERKPIVAVYQGSKCSLDSKSSNEKENTNLSLRNRASVSTPSHVMFSEKTTDL